MDSNSKREDIYNRLAQLLKCQFEVEEYLISEKADIRADLGLSLMQFAELTLELEYTFGMKLTNVNVLPLRTVGHIVNFISNYGSISENGNRK